MKPSNIENVMDLAQRARTIGEIFNPLFIGPPGVGKSHIVQAWARKNEIPLIDLRAAYLEAPDLIGFPSIKVVNDRQITVHNVPEFLPHDGVGVLLLEEPNRATTSMMNCLMQLLTDRKIHKYELPKDWLIAACINPENAEYDVNTMDAALKDRFEMFHVEYDKVSFIEHMYEAQWHQDVVNFVESNSWNYLPPEKIKNAPGAKYVSPRTLSKLNAALKATFLADDEMMIYDTILGSNVAKDFYNFRHDECPVTMNELLKRPDRAFRRLAKLSDVNNYKTGMIALTVKDIVQENTISDELLANVALALPVEHSTALICSLEAKRNDDTILQRLCKFYPEIKGLYKTVLKNGK